MMGVIFFRKNRFVFGLMIIFITLSGCADRKRDNPLDPSNSATNGKPVGIDITSIGQKTILTWNKIDVDDLIGVRVLRQTKSDSSLYEIALVKNRSHYEDLNVNFGITYTYRVQIITETYQSPLSDQVTITPGPSSIWVTTGSGGSVFKLTHDASHLLFESSLYLYPLGITPLGYNNGVLVSDFFLNQVVRVSDNGQPITWLSGFISPTEIEYDSRRAHFWVVENDLGRIFLSDTLGNSNLKLTNLQSSTSISVDDITGNCWIADPVGKKVGLIKVDGSAVQSFSGFFRPEGVSVNRLNGTCWVADSSRLVKLDQSGNKTLIVDGFQEAIRVAVNEKSGECWAIDWSPDKDGSKIVKISDRGEKIFEILGFYNPLSLDVDLYDGSCLVADTYNFRIVKISADGETIGQWSSSRLPIRIRVISQ